MELLTQHHLYYFWVVAREGSVGQVCARLGVAPSIIDRQIHALEELIGQPLFTEVRGKLLLTEGGQDIYSYADEIFGFFVQPDPSPAVG